MQNVNSALNHSISPGTVNHVPTIDDAEDPSFSKLFHSIPLGADQGTVERQGAISPNQPKVNLSTKKRLGRSSTLPAELPSHCPVPSSIPPKAESMLAYAGSLGEHANSLLHAVKAEPGRNCLKSAQELDKAYEKYLLNDPNLQELAQKKERKDTVTRRHNVFVGCFMSAGVIGGAVLLALLFPEFELLAVLVGICSGFVFTGALSSLSAIYIVPRFYDTQFKEKQLLKPAWNALYERLIAEKNKKIQQAFADYLVKTLNAPMMAAHIDAMPYSINPRFENGAYSNLNEAIHFLTVIKTATFILDQVSPAKST